VSRLNILYVTTVSGTMGFFPEHIKMLQGMGHTVELACNLDKPLPEEIASLACPQHHISFSRSPFSKDNLAAYWELKKLLSEGHYDIVHTHTPNASALVRLACRKLRRAGTKVFYTAHGFHFYTGAPLKNWLIYYPVERFLSRWTDVLITINQEDCQRAKGFHAQKTVFVHGVGIDVGGFALNWTAEQRAAKRAELGVGERDLMLLSVGELSRRKNHETVLKAMAECNDPSIRYFICGGGPLKVRLEEQIKKLGLEKQVKLLGVRRDIAELDQAADLFVFPSLQEGLPVALMESMACGSPVICSNIRGNLDLIVPERGGILLAPDDVPGWAAAIRRMMRTPELRQEMGRYNRQAVQSFDTEIVLEELRQIYG